MNPVAKYFLARTGLFAAIAVPLAFVLNLWAALAVGLLGSMVLGFALLRGQREAMIDHIDAGVKRRKEEKERLRAELAGEDA
ncbi:DUF4229 domain-containing protein [Glycomyces harbinensis]|uniref:DUF4229 domain-containing protein n=1 Tax=Glycomyces harbinensis TaxID=58114 RepID=A0A1G7CLU6_9ACTN|nr:DUF4229 domain-containing protein [Glycomyces harbinensis]SDE39710.1 Protein of unknown function [Glycomyces harbinensis]